MLPSSLHIGLADSVLPYCTQNGQNSRLWSFGHSECNRIKDRDGTIKGGLIISVSFCILRFCLLSSTNKIIKYDKSLSLIGWLNFHTFTCTDNIAMCWEPDPHPRQRSFVFKDCSKGRLA